MSSRFGKLLIAMRDDENRVRFMGYNPVILKTLVFTVSGGIAGVAGALFVPQVGIIGFFRGDFQRLIKGISLSRARALLHVETGGREPNG